MRKTNEEFMAEVMMRSAVYRRHRKQKLTAAAGMLCMLLAVGIGTVFYLRSENGENLRNNRDAYNLTGEYADHEADAVSSAAEESYAAEASSLSDSEADSAAPADSRCEPADEPQESLDSTPRNGFPVTDNSGKITGYFMEMPDSELFAYYGINGMPGYLSGTAEDADGTEKTHYCRLVDTEKAGFPHGLTFPDEESGTIIGDANTWMYREDETCNLLFVTISGRSFPEDYSAVPESVLHRCLLTTGELYILIESDIADENIIDGGCAKELYYYFTSEYPE